MATLTRAALALGLAALATPGLAQAPARPIALNSVSIDLPSGEAFPAGPGWDVVDSNCLSCHSAGMVLNQPPLSKAVWEKEVNKMISVYKAPVSAEDVPAIVAYLDAIKGVKPAPSTAAAK